MLVIEFWRSRLFPSDLAYMRSMQSSGHHGYFGLPDAYTIPDLARVLAALRARHGTPRRQVRQGWGRVVRISFDARPVIGSQWRNYQRREENHAL